MRLAQRHDLVVIEDAAQGVTAYHKGMALGAIGHLGCYSFPETKNIISGEGGALLVNDLALSGRAEIIREKGTNRSEFFRGQVDKYTWVDIGSSYLPGEIIAAFLWAQMEEAESIAAKRMAIWERYHSAFAGLEEDGRLRRPIVPPDCSHNAHMYYLVMRDLDDRSGFIEGMNQRGVNCVFHYVPLHLSSYAKNSVGKRARTKVGQASGRLPVTENMADRIVRLPLYTSMSEEDQMSVIRSVVQFARETGNQRASG
jgi:dTDP-4-amino-4,6-dideoxygalactose transaminase